MTHPYTQLTRGDLSGGGGGGGSSLVGGPARDKLGGMPRGVGCWLAAREGEGGTTPDMPISAGLEGIGPGPDGVVGVLRLLGRSSLRSSSSSGLILQKKGRGWAARAKRPCIQYHITNYNVAKCLVYDHFHSCV
jgi:hypothetical protein